MLTYVRLQNFRSCIDTEWHLEPVTLLIGTNNAGKSNLCKALRFISACAGGGKLDDAARPLQMPPAEILHRTVGQGAIRLSLRFRPDELPGATYRYSVTLMSRALSTMPHPVLSVLDEDLEWDDGHEQVTLLERRGERTVLLQDGARDERVRSNGHAPPEELALTHLRGSTEQGDWFARQITSWRYYNLANCNLRSRQPTGYDAYLRDDGSNLASCVFALKNEDPRRFDLLLKMIREVEPAIYTFNFISPRPEEVYLEVEDSDGGRYGPDGLSDGTLNYLAMCYIALQGQLTTHRDTPRPRLVVLEEPENGLYVRHLRRLLEVIREGSKEQQTIITTHNPYLIDLFEDHLEEVRLVTRGHLGVGETTQVTTPDEDVLRKRLQEFSLGELHFRELLQ